MALKAVVDSLDAVDASLHSLYVKTESGKFRLDVDGGFQTNEEAAGLLASVKSTLAERDAALEKLKPLEAALHGVDDVAGFVASAKTMASELEALKGKDKDQAAKLDQLRDSYEAQMRDNVAAVKASLEDQLKERDAALDAKSNIIRELSIGNAFATSDFIQKHSVVKGPHAMAILGRHFEAVEDSGSVKIVAKYADGVDVLSQERPGEPAGPHEAIRLIMQKHYPDLLTDKTGSGSSGGNGGSGGGAKAITRAQYDQMSAPSRAEFFKNGGTVKD